jgi:hypothetical protein
MAPPGMSRACVTFSRTSFTLCLNRIKIKLTRVDKCLRKNWRVRKAAIFASSRSRMEQIKRFLRCMILCGNLLVCVKESFQEMKTF